MAARLYHVLLLCALALHAHSAMVTQGPGEYSGTGGDSEDPDMLVQDVSVQDIKMDCPTGCSCLSVEFSNTLKVTCKSYTGSTLPENIPKLKNGSTYELLFTNSRLKSIAYRPYLKNTTKVIVSHSDITEISPKAWHALACDVKVLHLDGNKLQRLPDGFDEEEFHSLMYLRLGGNPWECDCKAVSLRQFLLEHGQVIKDKTDKDDIKCHSPSQVANRKILDVGIDQFCSKAEMDIAPYLAVAAVVFIIVIVAVIIVVFLRRRRG